MLRRTDEHSLRPLRSRRSDPIAGFAASHESGDPRPQRGEGRGLMTGPFYAAGLACLVLVCAGASRAQDRTIVISDALSANAQALKVKMGSQWSHRVWKVSFGDYAVGKGSSQVEESAASSTTKEAKKNDIWQRVSTTKTRYDFTLSDSRSNLAIVQAVNDVSAEEFKHVVRTLKFLNPKKWLDSVLDADDVRDAPLWNTETYWKPDESSNRSQVFSAVINTSADDADTWVLIMAMSEGADLGHEREASLSNGERQIQIVGTSSNKHGADPRAYPALGYEFVEGEQTLCALQYNGGGGFMSDYKRLIWIDSRLDQRMKLILAAAMTSLLQLPGIGAPGVSPGS